MSDVRRPVVRKAEAASSWKLCGSRKNRGKELAKKRKGFIFKDIVKSTKYPLIDVEKPELFREVFPSPIW